MENASKALIIAGGVLIGILIMSLGVYLFMNFGATSAEIHKQVEEQQLVEFNTKFTSYEGKKGLTIHDAITVAGYANENNMYHNDELSKYGIVVLLNDTQIQDNTDEENAMLISSEMSNINGSTGLTTYKCSILEYHQENGRVKKIKFAK